MREMAPHPLAVENERLRDALRRLISWEKYDADYADDVTQREHDIDYEMAVLLLTKSDRTPESGKQ